MKYRNLALAASLLLFLCLAFPSANGVSQSPAGTARIEILPATPTANDNISIKLSGEWPNTCIPQAPRLSLAGNQILIATSNPGQTCGLALTSWNHTLSIGKLPAGSYQVTVAHSTPTESRAIGTQSFTVLPPGVGLQFYPLPQPVRLLDTRPDASACFTPGEPLGDDAIHTQQVIGACTGIPAEAQAIVGNATVVNSPTISWGLNWVTLYSSDAQQPNASNLNFTEEQIVPNGFTVKLGTDGAFNIYSRAATHFIVDVTGYYAPPSPFGGLYYHPLSAPVRLFDTRSGQLACDAPGIPLADDDTRTVTAHGFCLGATIPHNAKAIVGNATVVNSISGGANWITLYPFGTEQPNVSNLNYTEDQIVPNWFTVGLSSDGKFNVYSAASTDFIVDVAGYFSEDPLDVNGPGLLFKPLRTPVRLLDTRPGESACHAPGAPLPNDNTISLQATGICFSETIPATAKAVEGNATVVNFISTGFDWITLYPCGVLQPNTSNLNFTADQIVPNWFVTKLSPEGRFCIYSRGATHFIVDVSGYFAL